MVKWWKEVWTAGEGAGRTYCGIARTVEGYAVDLFRGDSCIASELHETCDESERAASELSRRHAPRQRFSDGFPGSRRGSESHPLAYGLKGSGFKVQGFTLWDWGMGPGIVDSGILSGRDYNCARDT